MFVLGIRKAYVVLYMCLDQLLFIMVIVEDFGLFYFELLYKNILDKYIIDIVPHSKYIYCN